MKGVLDEYTIKYEELEFRPGNGSHRDRSRSILWRYGHRVARYIREIIVSAIYEH